MSASRFQLGWLRLLLFLATATPGQAAHILALFTNTQRSHQLVHAAVVQALLERDHHVTVLSVLPLDLDLPRDGQGRLRFVQLQEAPLRATGSSDVGANGVQKLQRMLDRVDRSGRVLEDPALRGLLSDGDARFDLLLLGYLFNDYLLGVAAHFGCPAALVWPSQPISFVHSLMGNPEERWYVPQPYDRHQYRGLRALAFGVFEKFVELLALERMGAIYESHFPPERYPGFEAVRRNVSLALCNHHSVSEGPIAPYVPGIVEIGGIQRSGRKEALSESLRRVLDESPRRHVIFLSLGSRVKWSALPPRTATVFREVFARLSANATIIWTYEGNCSALLAEPSPHVVCGSWFPQDAILAHPRTALFLTHGGKGSISEALYHGVPVLGLPVFGDQRPNVAKMARRGFGLQLDLFRLEAGPLFAAIDDLLRNRTYAENVRRFSRLYRDRPASPRDTAVFWLEYVVRHKGATHLDSPLRHLSAWQHHLVDVYAAILGGFVALLLACSWLERRLAPQ